MSFALHRRVLIGSALALSMSACRLANPEFDLAEAGASEVTGEASGEAMSEGPEGDGDGEPEGDGDDEPDCPDGLELCGDECVDLDSDPDHCTECDNPCPEGEQCEDGCVPFEYRLVFLTSTLQEIPDIGLDGGDKICEMLAINAQYLGTFEPWLGFVGEGPNDIFAKEGPPWALRDGTVVAEDWEQLSSGSLLHPIDLDENGLDVSIAAQNPCQAGLTPVFTGVLEDGSPSPPHTCGDWTADDGDTRVGIVEAYETPGWTHSECEASCATKLRLYCFEQ